MAALDPADAEAVVAGDDDARIIGDVQESDSEDGVVAIRGLELV